MTDNEPQGLVKIRRALISVSDKTGIVEFAHELRRFNVEIISTGGTAKTLRDAGIEVRDVSDVTGFPEMMDGRIKTLHPKIHGGLLGLRDNPEHVATMGEHDIEPIDMVVVNLYPFGDTVSRPDVLLEEAIEQIDIGGPAMLRSAAKNFRHVAVVSTPESYEIVTMELAEQSGSLSLHTRGKLGAAAFSYTAIYDLTIAGFLMAQLNPEEYQSLMEELDELELEDFATDGFEDLSEEIEGEEGEGADDFHTLFCEKIEDLRYGENPHQAAAVYDLVWEGADDEIELAGIAHAEQLSGKDMSFNNYVDADAAWQLVCDLPSNACAIIKHTNPAGAAIADSVEQAYRRALACDPLSAFGGVVAFNITVDEPTARVLTEIFTEVIVAPDFEEEALAVLGEKRNLRLLRAGEESGASALEFKQISGGMLIQTRDTHELDESDLQVVTKRKPTESEIADLLFAWTVCKHTKSNAIVYARDGQTVGVGAGQMSRVDSVKLGAMRAQLPVAGTVLASDAFFPFRDGIDEAAKHGITAIIQPGGSVRDEEAIAAADEHGLAMVFTGIRHFKH
jgi:phosphoribosylaminoimidazolecarboxamide formyltransferase/IMP cyclohydrolase